MGGLGYGMGGLGCGMRGLGYGMGGLGYGVGKNLKKKKHMKIFFFKILSAPACSQVYPPLVGWVGIAGHGCCILGGQASSFFVFLLFFLC
jgi:hypothetical protein